MTNFLTTGTRIDGIFIEEYRNSKYEYKYRGGDLKEYFKTAKIGLRI